MRFGSDGSEYEIDLSKKIPRRSARKLAPFIGHARKRGRAGQRAGRTAASRDRSGRIPANVAEQYEPPPEHAELARSGLAAEVNHRAVLFVVWRRLAGQATPL